MRSTDRKYLLVLLMMASLLPKFCLVLDVTVLDRIAFLIDNAQMISSDLRVLKT